MEVLIFVSKSMAILSIFYIVYFLFLRKETIFNAKRYFFLTGILASIILPFVEFTKHIYIEQPSFLSPDQSLLFQDSIQTISVEMPFDWWLVIYTVYGLGLIFFIIRFVIQLISLKKMINKYPSAKQDKYLLVKMREKISPFSFFNYIIFNPEQHKQEELDMILQHEKVHASQWHSVDLILVNLVQAMHWVNPLVWLYKKSLEENLEFIADNETVITLESKKQYQLALLKNLSTLGVPMITSPFYQSTIKKRIIMLNKSTTKKRNVWKLSFVLPFLCIFLWSFNTIEETHYIPFENSIGKTMENFMILPTSTDQELDLIESYFDGIDEPAKIKISNRGRDKNGFINSFEFKTKFKNQDQFYRRFSVNGDPEFIYKGHHIEYSEETINVSEIGPNATNFSITKDELKFINF